MKDEGRKETFQWIIPLSAQMLVKSIAEDGRDKFLDIKMFMKELEERGGIINKHVLTIQESIF